MISETAAFADERLSVIHQLLARLVNGEHSARGASSGNDQQLDQVVRDVNVLAETLERQQAINDQAEQRGNNLLEVMMSMAALDYSKRAYVGEGDDLFDALAAGLNMLADELVAVQESRMRLQEEIIQTQAAVIQELSTPVIPINDDVLVMPLIGNIDSARAQHVLERLLEGVVDHRAHTVILDITGVLVVDTQVANTLLRAAQAVQLLGTQVILTGIRPEVAQTLVNLGVNLGGLLTWSTMQMGIAHAMRHNHGSLMRSGR